MSTLRVMSRQEWQAHTGGGERRFTIPEPDAGTAARLHSLFGRSISAVDAVREIVADVRERGDEAVMEWTERLDGARVPASRVDVAWMARCLEELDPALRDALTVAAGRLRDFNELQVDTRPRGAPRLCLRPEPLRRAGCYVPGGRGAYPSTVLMSVIPAQVAGVESIAVTSRRHRTGASIPSSPRRPTCSVSTRCTPSAAPRRSRPSRTAPSRSPPWTRWWARATSS